MRALTARATKIVLLVALATGATPPLAGSSPADDPEVKAQIGLFSAWLEGQVAIRQLPGVVVGVVSDQDLIWAKGFGHADVDADRPMERLVGRQWLLRTTRSMATIPP